MAKASVPQIGPKMATLKFVMPESPYLAAEGTDATARLATLQGVFDQADEKIELAYDAADPGDPIERLLNLINHVVLADAVRPMLGEMPTRAEAEWTYQAMFHPLAALQGATALAAGTLLYQPLVEAFHLLDWAQTECEALALHRLLPIGQEVPHA